MSRDSDGIGVLQRYVPRHFHNPVGLALRLLQTGDRAALYAMWTAALGMLLTPLDILLSLRERDLYRAAPSPHLPLVLVCGASRSGTTLAEQILISSTSPTYLNNLTSLFPRSPVIANRVFASLMREPTEEFRSFYGKSVGLSGPNDALYLWDRWLGVEQRSSSELRKDKLDLQQMVRFFGALQVEHDRPIVNKNNNLICFAHVVAPTLPTAHFICLRRQREHLAQSLLLARRDIHGDLMVPYGIGSPVRSPHAAPIEDVCRQVLYLERMAQWQQEQIGADRFWIVQYEELCRDPRGFATRVYTELFSGSSCPPTLSKLTPFEPSTRVRVTSAEFERIVESFQRLESNEDEFWRAPGGAFAGAS